MKIMKRPKSITIVSLFYWFSALYFGVVGIISILLLIGPYLNGVVPLTKIFSTQAPLDYLFLGLPVLGIGMAIFLAIVAWGLWRLKKKAHLAATIGSSLLAAVGLFIIIIRFFQGELGIPYTLIFHGLVLWELSRKNVKVAFGLLPFEEYTESKTTRDIVRELTEQAFCLQCGEELRKGAVFCHKCGAKQEESRI